MLHDSTDEEEVAEDQVRGSGQHPVSPIKNSLF
jgi:hypothetical protein